MKRLLLPILVIISLPANADYFFSVNNAVMSKCLNTPISNRAAVQNQLEKALGVSCDRNEDSKGTSIITCKAMTTNIFYVTDSIETCTKIRNSMKSLLKANGYQID